MYNFKLTQYPAAPRQGPPETATAMKKGTITSVVTNYIEAYNCFDVEAMLAHLHPEIEFENISDGAVTLSLKGMEDFKKQAQEATRYFAQRKQTVTGLTIQNERAEAIIAYEAILAIDLPNGLKAGDKLELKGRSVFTFQNDQIIRIQDFS